MDKVFESGAQHDRNVPRSIMIRIADGFIEFFFYEQYLYRKKWIEEEIERRLQNGQDDLEEDQKSNNNFYWIAIDHWVSDRKETRQGRPDNWHKHMFAKSWFTDEMYSFIEKNV